MKIHSTLLLLMLVVPFGAQASYIELPTGMPNVNAGDIAWGDFDADGDLDAALCGYDGAGYFLGVFRNDGGTFVDVLAGMEGIYLGALGWGDADGDGDLDLATCGLDQLGDPLSVLYRNDGGGSFSPVPADLAGQGNGSVDWGDFDNDGDLDLLLNGSSGTDIYRNEGNMTFTKIYERVDGYGEGLALWIDFDVDGALDILVSGGTSGNRITRTYRNDGLEVFTFVSLGLPGLDRTAAAWADYDRDGDPDLVMSGGFGFPDRISRVYRNDLTMGFTNIGAILNGVLDGDLAWGDHDNDGDFDILLGGQAAGLINETVIYSYMGLDIFLDLGEALPGISDAGISWGDCDGDGDLDIAMAGQGDGGRQTSILLNQGVPSNEPPDAPTGLTTSVIGDRVTFSWTGSTDDITPAAGLTYNIRVGTTSGAGDVCPAQATATGWRLVPKPGNTPHGTERTLILQPGTYYWTVQAIDDGYSGSAFATEQIVTFEYPESPFIPVDMGLFTTPGEVGEWGDYDNDGDLDLVLAGYNGVNRLTLIFRNDGSSFVEIGAGILGLNLGDVAWGDYDGDGDIDLIETGQPDGGGSLTRIYRNDGGVFQWNGVVLPGTHFGDLAWGDLDGDGDLDVVITGDHPDDDEIMVIYRNDGNEVFTLAPANLPGFYFGDLETGDYDGDGDIDLLVSGSFSTHDEWTRFYRNEGDWTFTERDVGFIGTERGFVDLADYDADGDLDVVVAGYHNTTLGAVTRIYRNDGGEIFTDIGAYIPGLDYSAGEFGDYDADGDLDLLIGGRDNSKDLITRIYRNDGNDIFTNLYANLPPSAGIASWGDMDADGDLDILYDGISRLILNDGDTVNTPPGAPSGLGATIGDGMLQLSWLEGTDVETPGSGLSYNLRVGTIPGAMDVMAPMAAEPGGLRRVVEAGNAQQRTGWAIELPPGADAVYWSVQAIDGGFAGGPFAPEEAVQVTSVPEPVPGMVTALHPPFPNPFNPRVTITFTMATTGNVELTVHDLGGRLVKRLQEGELPAGEHKLVWDGNDQGGRPVSSGRYVCRFEADGRVDNKGMVLVR